MDSFKEIWNAVLTYCEERVTETAFNLWIKKTEFVSFEAATITLRLPSAMYMDVVISQYGTMFSEAFAAIMGFEVKIKYICAEDNDREEHKFYQDKQHLEDYKTSNIHLKISLLVQVTGLHMLPQRLLRVTRA